MALGWRGQYIRYRGFFLNILELYKRRANLRAFLEVILSISTIVIFITFALRPTVLTIISLNREIKEKKVTLAALNEKGNNLLLAFTVLSQNEGVIPDIDTAVATSPNPEVISKQILGIASKNSVTLLGLSIGEVNLVGQDSKAKKPSEDLKPIPNASEMPISISIKGDYPSIEAFARDMENLRTVVKIDTFGINASVTEIGTTIVGVITGRVPFTGKPR